MKRTDQSIIFTSSDSIPGERSSKNRPTKYRCWDDINMREAINSVTLEGFSVSNASKIHGVPRSTLSDRIAGRVLPGAKLGRPTVLTSSEEKDVVEFLLHSASIGFGKTRNEVILIVNRMLAA